MREGKDVGQRKGDCVALGTEDPIPIEVRPSSAAFIPSN